MTPEMQIDSYLTALRLHLGPLTIAEREEIVREIAAHVRDSAEESGASVETILARLGPAKELAAQYRDGLLIRKASRSHSPLVLLRATLRLATKSVFGIFVLFCGIFGYSFGAGFVVIALAKTIVPAHAGAWVQDGRLVSMGAFIYGVSPQAHEVLGMWIIPLGLIAGSLTLLLTTFLIRTSLRVSQRLQSKL
ncbi:MAG: DUF1700 domain-containing protein [Terracidiphilus sp.]|jgi:uncharacterized membrane protein